MRNHLSTSQLLLVVSSTVLLSCADHRAGIPPHGEVGVAVAPLAISGNTVNKAGPTTPVSGGPNLLGVAVPTTTALAARIQNGLQGMIAPTSGNFARALGQVRTNLPKVSDVHKASGFDQVQLLAYAACSDLTTGGTPLMRSRYNIIPTSTVAANQAALISAGMSILDQHTAGLASQGPNAAQVTTVITNLVQAQVTNASTSTVAFMTVCIAANTAGATMLGF